MKKAEVSFRRKRKLVKPRLQLHLVASFFGIAAICFLLHTLLLSNYLAEVALEMPLGGRYLVEQIPDLMLGSLGVAFALLLPLVLLVGVNVTFRIVGPIHRFEQHMRAILRGEDPGECRIRKGDQLQDFCDLLNRTLAHVGSRGAVDAGNPAAAGARPEEEAEEERSAA